jgi:hypothetical protein
VILWFSGQERNLTLGYLDWIGFLVGLTFVKFARVLVVWVEDLSSFGRGP